MRPEFTAPEFVTNSDPDVIQERMMNNLPPDISDMPGDFPYDFTMPTAIEASQLIQFNLVRALMVAFPEFAWDDWLDLHGEQAHVTRRKANAATGYVEVAGEAGVEIEAGTVFCVPATDTRSAVEFSATEKAVLIGEEHTVRVPIKAVEAGAASNVMADTITIMSSPKRGVIAIRNPEETSGGTEAETDEAYYDRIHAEFEGARSYVGNDNDYIRWAKEVEGIGDCIVAPAWNGPGTVKLILVDSNGSPANEQLLNAVYNHIVSPGDRSKRLLPAGDATLTVAAARTKDISYLCTGMVIRGMTTEEAVEAFKAAVQTLYPEAKELGVVRYNDVRPLLADIDGIEDFEDFLMNGGHANVPLEADEYADTSEVVFQVKEA